jgi:hypothetical protein
MSLIQSCQLTKTRPSSLAIGSAAVFSAESSLTMGFNLAARSPPGLKLA